MTAVDVVAVMVAASLPWSTLVSIFITIWVLALLPTLQLQTFLRLLSRPECLFPIALFVLAIIGTLWATDIPWAARMRRVNPAAKLLAIPLLIFHFERSSRGNWVWLGFLFSCIVLMVVSWISLMAPTLIPTSRPPGVPVKNYIDQSQSFALCAVVLACQVTHLFSARRYLLATVFALISSAFIANMMFVVVARTALTYVPVMLLTVALLQLRGRVFVLSVFAAIVVVALVWLISPNLQSRTQSIFQEYSKYGTGDEITSVGLRLEFWRKSLIFFTEAPLAGHGTGSTQTLFDRSAIGQTGLAEQTISNPHNQTLNVAIQWGLIGCVILYAMWSVHLLMFRGAVFAASIGLMAVVQNIISSLFNSHLFDFVPGWIYVISVGVAGGMVLRLKNKIDDCQLTEPTRAHGAQSTRARS